MFSNIVNFINKINDGLANPMTFADVTLYRFEGKIVYALRNHDDERRPIVYVVGDTYAIRDALKARGGVWNAKLGAWAVYGNLDLDTIEAHLEPAPYAALALEMAAYPSEFARKILAHAIFAGVIDVEFQDLHFMKYDQLAELVKQVYEKVEAAS